MTKICDTCSLYAPKYQFCFARYMRIGKNLVSYCKGYKPIKPNMKGRGKSCKSYTV